MAQGIRFRTFLHVALVRKNTDMRELHAKRVQFSYVRVFSVHVRVFSDSRNVQKSVTRIIYLGPLPEAQGKLEVQDIPHSQNFQYRAEAEQVLIIQNAFSYILIHLAICESFSRLACA